MQDPKQQIHFVAFKIVHRSYSYMWLCVILLKYWITTSPRDLTQPGHYMHAQTESQLVTKVNRILFLVLLQALCTNLDCYADAHE